jgi:hypothetical protein
MNNEPDITVPLLLEEATTRPGSMNSDGHSSSPRNSPIGNN